MRIAVCNAHTPFAQGGAEILADSLVANLRQRGHEAELVRIPFRWYPKDEIVKGYLAWRLMNLEEAEGVAIDRVIALKFPAYAVPHPRKTVWLIQQLRQAYDLLGSEYSHFDQSAEDAELLATVHHMDTRTIGEAKQVFTISDNVGKRLLRHNDLDSETLYPPPSLDGRYHSEDHGDYVFSLCRLNPLKRVDRLIEAMAHTRSSVRCLIGGRGPELDHLKTLARKRHVADRVEFLGFVSDEAMLDLYAGALAVYYAPLDEDYGLATVEAFKSGRPMLTTMGSGGVLEFVEDGVNGYVTPADEPAAMAARIDALHADRALAARLGAAGMEKVRPITWDRTIQRLLEG